MRSKLFLISLIALFSLNKLYAQKAQLDQREKFLKKYEHTLSGSENNDVKTFLKKELTPLVMNLDKFPDNRFKQMKTTIDLIINDHHSAYPDSYNYVQSVYSLVKKKKTGEVFDQWHKIVDELLKNRNPKHIEEFLAQSAQFLYKNIIAENRNFYWFAYPDDFSFSYSHSPYLKLDNVTLVCRTLNSGLNRKEHPYADSVKIIKTNGVYNLSLNKWKGDGGRFTWEKVGLSAAKTFANLSSYSISFHSTNLNADTVTLTTPYIDHPIKGKLRDRAMIGAQHADNQVPFPRFLSYKANFTIKNIVKGVDYEGGFSLVGDEFIGIGNKNNQAKLTYYRNGKPFVVTHSDRVSIGKKSLKTNMASMSLYFGTQDSIFHPGLDVTYTLANKTLRIDRAVSAQTQAPFVDSYHKLDLYVDEIAWKENTNQLVLGYTMNTSTQQRKAKFESFNYYDGRLYQSLRGSNPVNPLYAIYHYAYKYDKFTMTDGNAASALRSTIDQVKTELLRLSTMGFLNYDVERGIIHVTQKAIHFVKANSGKVDYDNLSFVSNLAPIQIDNIERNGKVSQQQKDEIKEKNAARAQLTNYGIIDLSSLDLNLNAIDVVKISDAKHTAIFPSNHKLTVKKNRTFDFAGWISSGKWEVKVEKGNYSYAKNKFNIFKSDIAFFNVPPLRKEDGNRAIPLQSKITGLKGELLVDDVSNRSGLSKKFENYPILVSKEKTKVFYDYKKLYKGAYDKDRFYFTVDPFKVDSLLSFNTKTIHFKGVLTSAGIFPPIKNELKVMNDYSLGFSQTAPAGGYPFYGDVAKYSNKILLSNNGLQGAGTINFINATAKSKRLFTFLPDSTVGVATFVNKPQTSGVQFPDASSDDAYITYLPKDKIFKASSNKKPISMFNEEANLLGTLTIKSSGMKGDGVIDLEDAAMGSSNFHFTRWVAKADTSEFQLKNKFKDTNSDENPLAISTDNVNGTLDFKKRKGVFKSNQGQSIVRFPVNQYICKIDQFTWLMDDAAVSLEHKTTSASEIAIKGGVDLVGPNFFSVNPAQDSLQFMSPEAKYDLKKRTIFAKKVKYIRVADAKIFPDSGNVVIRKKAKMDPLKNSKIVANYITKYHTIVNATTQIKGRKSYLADGDYSYGIKDSKNRQMIHMSKIEPNASFETVASGDIVQADSFKLSDHFRFYGKVQLNASKPALLFDGATKLIHDCNKFQRNWLAFKTYIDPSNIQIPVGDDMHDLEGNKIMAGILWRNSNNTDSVSMYPTFLSAVNSDDDPVVIKSHGLLQYDKDAHEFQIGSKEKLANRNAPGNFISLHTESCSMHGDGVIHLGLDLGEVKTKAVGVVNYNQRTNKTDFNITLALFPPVDHKIFEKIGDNINKTTGLNGADFNSSTIEQAMAQWIDQKTADKIKSDYVLKKEFKSVPKALKDAIVISGLRLSSHTISGDQDRGIISSVDQAIVVNVFGTPVMKYVPFKLFATQRSRLGDRLAFKIDIPGSFMYFIDYDYRKNGIMSILTSDKSFNEEVSALKPNNKKTKSFSYDVTKKSAYLSLFMHVFK